MPNTPKAAAAEGLSKLTVALLTEPGCPRRVDAAGDFFSVCGDDRGPCGENAAWDAENGVETGGLAPAAC